MGKCKDYGKYLQKPITFDTTANKQMQKNAVRNL